MMITEEDGKYYNMGKEMSTEEILAKLNDYEYAVRTRTLHEREQLIKERAVNEHLKRENRILCYKIDKLVYSGIAGDREGEVEKELTEVDKIVGEWQKTQLENEELKKELYFLKH